MSCVLDFIFPYFFGAILYNTGTKYLSMYIEYDRTIVNSIH